MEFMHLLESWTRAISNFPPQFGLVPSECSQVRRIIHARAQRAVFLLIIFRADEKIIPFGDKIQFFVFFWRLAGGKPAVSEIAKGEETGFGNIRDCFPL
jgi:hypothetical protein